MTRSSNVVLALLLGASLASSAAAQEGLVFTLADVEAASAPLRQEHAIDPKQAIVRALGELRWGMSKAELVKLLTSQIRAEYESQIKFERDVMRQDALYQQARERAHRLSENFVTFEGPKNGWDVSPIAGEFTRGNREAMLVVTGKHTRDMYFFIQGRLWKWYREVSPEAVSAANAAEALAVLSQRFGPGSPQQDRRDESSGPYEGATWSDESTRVTALRRGGDTCLIFEDRRTLEKLVALRFNAQGRSGKTSAATIVDSIMLTDAERKARDQ
jgi:hypothetical protein